MTATAAHSQRKEAMTMTNSTKATRDVCDACGAAFEEGHFSSSDGKVLCSECHSGRRPPSGIMPPTPAYKRQLKLWCAPRTGTPPRQQTLRLGELAQPGEVLRG